MNQAFIEYYRCPEIYADFELLGEPSARDGYFRFGPELICYGRTSSNYPADRTTDPLHDVSQDVRMEPGTCSLPINPNEVIDNLRNERYVGVNSTARKNDAVGTLARKVYYLLRPHLSVSVRTHLQRAWLKGWDKIPFPQWPVDSSVDQFLETLLILSIKANKLDKMPFIWFWPEGHSSCTIMTHDVETATGLACSSTLMDLDDSFGIKASFQLIPEGRYEISQRTLFAIRNRGFEINIHDLNHDGHLYRDRNQFLDRAARINHYAEEYGAEGFRSGALYRNLDWYDAFDFSYDMSVPNVGHLDPQRGGCCTVMPYFVGHILELPLTTTQDYSLFQILGDYSTDLWEKQIQLIRENHGLVSFIVHPDYVTEARAQNTYKTLLCHLSRLRSKANVWMALPGEVDRWWRQRAQMKIVNRGGKWRIDGQGAERANLAFATFTEGSLKYAVADASRT